MTIETQYKNPKTIAAKTKAIQFNSKEERDLTTTLIPQTTGAIGLQNEL